MNGKAPLGVYVHLPFCRRKCSYCDFYSVAEGGAGQEEYVSALLRHAALWQEALDERTADTIYLGGGTPSLLHEDELYRLVSGLRRIFHADDTAEVTMEGNPDSIRPELLHAAVGAGVNRLSIGVQSFADDKLAALGRLHTSRQAAEAVEISRRAGIRNLSLDLMFSLPGQRTKDFASDLSAAAALSPEHISCYALKLERGTPLHQTRDSLHLPDEDTEYEMYQTACGSLSGAGYQHYEISSFAKEGFAGRHNLKYWQGEEYLGLGAAAHSCLDHKRFCYDRSIEGYLGLVSRGQTLPGQTEMLSRRDRQEEYILTGLRTARGIDLEHPLLRDIPVMDQLVGKAFFYEKNGLATVTGSRIALTERGFWLSNTLIAGLISAAGL